jgi:predicted transcriptional regulator
METQDQPTERIIRTTLTISETLDKGLRELAEKNGRPLSWEYRRAIEAHIAANAKGVA